MMRNVSCLVVLLAAAGCSGRKGKPDRPAVPVTIAPVRRMSLPYTLMANGLVTPLQTAIVAPQVDGIITEVSFREGQNVSPGQVLFQIEAQPYVAAYQQAQAMLARDSATAANARRDADRYDQLEQTDYVTKEQAEQQRATAAAAEGTAAADRAALATAKFNLDKTTIRAPIPGRTGSLLVRVGNVVHAAGATPLVVIDQIKPILVRFAVPGTELPLIQQYGARGALPVTATIGAATGGSQPPRDPSAGNGYTATLTVSIPIFSGWSQIYDVKAASAAADAAALRAQGFEQQVIYQVFNAYYALRTSTQLVRTSRDLLASATESEQVALGRYKAGAGSLLDLLTAQAALASARAQAIQARFSWNTALAQLAHDVGILGLDGTSPLKMQSDTTGTGR